MKQTIALQTPGRSDLDQSSLFSFDQFTAARPTAPVIHRDARFLLVRSGSGVIRLQGREYPLSAGSLAAILPWQISETVRVDEPAASSPITTTPWPGPPICSGGRTASPCPWPG